MAAGTYALVSLIASKLNNRFSCLSNLCSLPKNLKLIKKPAPHSGCRIFTFCAHKKVPEEVHELDETSPGCLYCIRQYGTCTERPEIQAQRNLAHRNALVWLEYKAYEENGR